MELHGLRLGAGAEVTAGTLNCDGTLRVEVRSAGQATFMADLARAVEAAQGRAAPVHRVADAVAGGALVRGVGSPEQLPCCMYV